MAKLLVGSEKTIVWVSDEDYLEALKHKWYINSGGYPFTKVKGKTVLLHRWVADRMGLALHELIDHKDRYKLNARRSNLRYADHQLNAFNTSISKNNKSGFKGVHWDKSMGAWRAKIRFNDVARCLGFYNDPISAAVAYDCAALVLFGEEFAATNLKLGLITEEDYKTALPPIKPHVRRRLGRAGFKGVTAHGNGFRAKVMVEGLQVNLGTYSTAEQAAKAYDNYIIENNINRATNSSLGLLASDAGLRMA